MATLAGRWRDLLIVALAFGGVTIALTYPWAFELSRLGRTDNYDTQYSIWNVAWVARTLPLDPLHVFDANIFHPHRWTLAYAEPNLGAGLFASPVYWITRDPHAAHNFVVLLSFVLAGVATYSLAAYLVADRRAAFIAALGFAFMPYVFGHIPHIQLLMTAGLPLTMLAFHAAADRPGPGRGAMLGLAMAAQTYLCAYYGVFGATAIVLAGVVLGISRGLLLDRRYLTALAVAATVGAAAVLPLAWPYLMLAREPSFGRSIDAARAYSADWEMYLLSAAFAHGWLRRLAAASGELLFPGVLPVVFAGLGILAARRAARTRETVLLYLVLGSYAGWASLGPAAGLYSVLYAAVPGFDLMRAPSRFGVLVMLAFAVLSAHGLAAILARVRRASLVAVLLAGVACLELRAPMRLTPNPKVAEGYRVLARMPRRPLLELPVYSHQGRLARIRYMLASTAHWMPLIVAYSDYTPPEFLESIPLLAEFPSRRSFDELQRYGVGYVVFHLDAFAARREALNAGLDEFAPYLRLLFADRQMLVYEIVAYPGES